MIFPLGSGTGRAHETEWALIFPLGSGTGRAHETERALLERKTAETPLGVLQARLRGTLEEIRSLRDPVAPNEIWALAQSVCDTEEVRDRESAEEWARRLASDIVDREE
jgi:hypothetical protein